MEPLNKEIL
jgi:transportin-1